MTPTHLIADQGFWVSISLARLVIELADTLILPMGIQGMEQVQEFFSSIAKATASPKGTEETKKKGSR